MTSGRRGALAGALASLLIAVVAACGDDPTEVQFETVEGVTYASAFVTPDGDTLTVDLGAMTELDSGVWMRDIVVGTGDTATAGDTLFVTYAGWLRDGSLLDAGTEFRYVLLVGGAIGGFHWGMDGMQVGGERLLVIPPEWAYGSLSRPPLYPGAVLVFDVVLDSIWPAP